MKKIGLVGGISWVSTIDYYRYINEGINERLGGLNFAECLVYSINFEEFQRNNRAGQWNVTYELLLHASQSLIKGGAEAIVLCANTAHAVADQLTLQLSCPLLHIATATAHAIQEQGLQTIGLLGTQFTMEMDFYTKELQKHGLTCLIPKDKVDRDFLQQTIRDELSRGLLKEATKQRYLSIIQALILQGAEGIILGCTEIPLLISQADISVPAFDTTRIHAAAAIAFALSDRPVNQLAPYPT